MTMHDARAQERAAAGDRAAPDERAYGALFEVLDAEPAPEPSAALREAVLARVAVAEARHAREWRLMRVLCAGLLLALIVFGVPGTIQALRQLGETGVLVAFSAAAIATAGSLATRLLRRQAPATPST